MNNLAQTFSLLGNFSEAESLHRQCVEGCKHTLGPYHALTLAGMNNLAEVLESQDKLEESEQLYRQVLKEKERHLDQRTRRH